MLDANDHFMDGIGERKPQNFLTHMRSFSGHGRHYWLWDFASTKNALERSGFQKIRRCKYGDNLAPFGRNVRQGDTAVVGALMGALAGVEEILHLCIISGLNWQRAIKAVIGCKR